MFFFNIGIKKLHIITKVFKRNSEFHTNPSYFFSEKIKYVRIYNLIVCSSSGVSKRKWNFFAEFRKIYFFRGRFLVHLPFFREQNLLEDEV